MMSEEVLLKIVQKTQHQTPLNPTLGASRSFILCFSQTLAIGLALHTLYK